MTRIHTGFHLRAGVSFQATETSNSHLPLQHLTLTLLSFYISRLRKDWISHLIKRDCIACCFLSCSFSLVHRQLFTLMLSPIPGHPQFKRQAGAGFLQDREPGPLSAISPQAEFPFGAHSRLSLIPTVPTHRTQSPRIHDRFQE